MTITILTDMGEFSSVKKPTSWERTEQRAVIKYGKRADKTLQTLGNS